MGLISLLLATGASLLGLAAVLRPLEVLFPAKPGQKLFRPGWALDLSFFLGQYLLWNGLVFWCLWHSRGAIGRLVPPEFAQAVAGQPFGLQVMEVVLLSDFCVYWGHRLQHRWNFLWRFHAVHHSAEHLDWLAAHREHPLDTVYTMTLINLPAFVLGFPLETLAGFIAFRGVWAIYIHSNVRLPLGPLRPLLGAPELHHWHHARDRDAGNYGNVCPLMDVLFGTYVCPDREPEAFGINQPVPSTWLGHMTRPLLPRGTGAADEEQRVVTNAGEKAEVA
ncbi:sterol desaturase family protein [Gemmata sp. JC673]|uniref:Sterol desaturase family protein n=1 Tax=Gemmata algarum TaxID=2975278 RepID=A0ABU5F5E7_9BACT|nr:sterol desaturase family protein [Gemmata algarum]MDY3562535.1 sterol desaturase family protein [Gemmata algarum]